jgi:hypothetical protein
MLLGLNPKTSRSVVDFGYKIWAHQIVASLGAGDGRGLPCPGYTASADRGNQNHILNDYTFWFESGHGSVTERFKPIATFMELLSTKVRRFDYR